MRCRQLQHGAHLRRSASLKPPAWRHKHPLFWSSTTGTGAVQACAALHLVQCAHTGAMPARRAVALRQRCPALLQQRTFTARSLLWRCACSGSCMARVHSQRRHAQLCELLTWCCRVLDQLLLMRRCCALSAFACLDCRLGHPVHAARCIARIAVLKVRHTAAARVGNASGSDAHESLVRHHWPIADPHCQKIDSQIGARGVSGASSKRTFGYLERRSLHTCDVGQSRCSQVELGLSLQGPARHSRAR